MTHIRNIRCLVLSICCLANVASLQAEQWSELSTKEQEILQPVREKWDGMNAEHQEHVLKRAQRIIAMSPEQRERAKKRFAHWQTLTPEQRKNMRQRYKKFRELPPEQKCRLHQLHRSLRDLPLEKRHELMRRWHDEHKQGESKGEFDINKPFEHSEQPMKRPHRHRMSPEECQEFKN